MEYKKYYMNESDRGAENAQPLNLEEIEAVAGGGQISGEVADQEELKSNAKSYGGDLASAMRSEAIRKILGK